MLTPRSIAWPAITDPAQTPLTVLPTEGMKRVFLATTGGCVLGAVGTAEDAPAGLHTMADNAASAMLAAWSHRVDSALEAVERPLPPALLDLKRLRVVVAAHVTTRHI